MCTETLQLHSCHNEGCKWEYTKRGTPVLCPYGNSSRPCKKRTPREVIHFPMECPSCHEKAENGKHENASSKDSSASVDNNTHPIV